jgi:hypothetical protein
MVLAEGTVQVRAYGNTQDRLKLDGKLPLGGGGLLHTSENARLLAALERGGDGFWIPRYDCLSAA